MKLALIGNGAIASYVQDALQSRPHSIEAILAREARVAQNPNLYVGSVAAFPKGLELIIDCAGHAALAAHGRAVLASGADLITVSLGALADQDRYRALDAAARQDSAKLHLAIGALDGLSAARRRTRLACRGRD